MGGVGSINVGDIHDNQGVIVIGSGNTVLVRNLAAFTRAFLPITPALIDDKRRQYYHVWNMDEPEWPFFDKDWQHAEDIPRKLYYELFTRITHPPDPARNYLQLVVAENGTGKTMLLMRLAADLCRQPGYGVLWLQPTVRDDAAMFVDQITDVAQKLGAGHKLFVMVDDMLTIAKMPIFLRQLRIIEGQPAQVIVVGAAQPGDLDNSYANPADIYMAIANFGPPDPTSDLPLAPFDEDELRLLTRLLDDNGQLVARLPRPIVWDKDSVVNTLGGPLNPPLTDYTLLHQPRQAMCLLTRGVTISERVERKLTEMQGQGDFRQPTQRNAMVNLYDEVILLHRTGTPASRAWLEAATQRDPQLAVALNAVYTQQYPTAGVMDVRPDQSITATHPLDAQAAYALLHPDPQSQRAAYAGMLGVAPLGAQSNVLGMLHGLLGSNASPAFAQNVNFVRGILGDAGGKVQQLIASANPYQLGSGWSSIYRRIGDLQSATQMATTVVNQGGLAQDVGPAYYNRALAHQAAGQPNAAAADFAKASELFNLPPNTLIPPLQPPPPPPHTVVTTTTTTTTTGELLGGKLLIGLLLLLLGAGAVGVWVLSGGPGPGPVTPTPVPQANATDTPRPGQPTDTPTPNQPTDTPRPNDTSIPTNANAELLKRAVANMQVATSYHIVSSQVNADGNASISGDIDVANSTSTLLINGGGNETRYIIIGKDSYSSTDGGNTFIKDNARIASGPINYVDRVKKIWSSFTPQSIDRAGDTLKDANPPTFPIDGTDTKHISAPADRILESNVDSAVSSFNQPNNEVEFWVVPDAAPTVLQLHIHTTAGGVQSVNFRWSNINQPLNITAPQVAKPTDTPAPIPLAAPQLLNPEANASLSNNPIDFIWRAVTASEPVYYDLEVDACDSNFANCKYFAGVTKTTNTEAPIKLGNYGWYR